MRQAIFLPAFDGLADPDRVVELAVHAEAPGGTVSSCGTISCTAEPVRDILDPYLCLAAVPRATSGIRLGPMVTPLVRGVRQCCPPGRHSVTSCHTARLVLGFGIGDDGGPGGELSAFGETLDPSPEGGRSARASRSFRDCCRARQSITRVSSSAPWT